MGYEGGLLPFCLICITCVEYKQDKGITGKRLEAFLDHVINTTSKANDLVKVFYHPI